MRNLLLAATLMTPLQAVAQYSGGDGGGGSSGTIAALSIGGGNATASAARP